jgi:hypothetical protein
MSDSLDAHIFQHHIQGATRDAICRLLHVGPNRVSRVPGFFHDNHHLPPSPQKGRSKKVTDEILDYIDVRTLGSARLSLSELTMISKALGDRTPLQVKNCWYSVLRKRELSVFDDIDMIMTLRSRVYKGELIADLILG